MLKRIGMLALILSATGGAVLPTAAFAQDGYAGRDSYYRADHKLDRHDSNRGEERERAYRQSGDRESEEWRQRPTPGRAQYEQQFRADRRGGDHDEHQHRGQAFDSDHRR